MRDATGQRITHELALQRETSLDGQTAPREEAPEGQAGTTSVTRDAAARATGHRSCPPHAASDR